jgi:hypothetical protein
VLACFVVVLESFVVLAPEREPIGRSVSPWSVSAKGLLPVRRRVADTCLAKRVSPFTTLRALPAVHAVVRLHAGERQLQRNAQLDAATDDVCLVERRERRLH